MHLLWASVKLMNKINYIINKMFNCNITKIVLTIKKCWGQSFYSIRYLSIFFFLNAVIILSFISNNSKICKIYAPNNIGIHFLLVFKVFIVYSSVIAYSSKIS